MRVHVRRQELPSGKVLFRLVEADERVVCRWLPWEPFAGALDKGGFDDLEDARGFALGIDRHRAEHGLIGGRTVAQIDEERSALDITGRGHRRKKLAIAEFEAA